VRKVAHLSSDIRTPQRRSLPRGVRHPMKIEIARYGNRFWAIYRNGELLAVTVYKKGAIAIRDALIAAATANSVLKFSITPDDTPAAYED
jgi:hypothetical protein